LLLDIEGTTTPIDFVFKTLFPFAAEHCEQFLRRHFHDPEVTAIVGELRATWSGAASAGAPVWIESTPDHKIASAVAYVRWLIARDSKITPLKTLQGKIWEEGFQRGELRGEVYSDVAPAFARWKKQARRIAIFSSGSILAQKLLFAHSTAGDLSSHIGAYFDTTAGPKREPQTYKKIAEALRLQPHQVLFISDVLAELDAAKTAQLLTAHSLRPGIAPQAARNHPAIQSFSELLPD
jgi:enolase-phosphatase E1